MPGIEFLPYRFFVVVAVPVILLAMLTIAGGVLAIQRKIWSLALAGAIIADLFSWFMGIPAVILTALSKDEFK